MHVWFSADVKKYALHGGHLCILLNNKDGLMVYEGFRPGVACWVDTLFASECACFNVVQT